MRWDDSVSKLRRAKRVSLSCGCVGGCSHEPFRGIHRENVCPPAENSGGVKRSFLFNSNDLLLDLQLIVEVGEVKENTEELLSPELVGGLIRVGHHVGLGLIVAAKELLGFLAKLVLDRGAEAALRAFLIEQGGGERVK